jgi:transposase-like protein
VLNRGTTPMKTYLICPTCGSDDIVKNGLTRRAKQNHLSTGQKLNGPP